MKKRILLLANGSSGRGLAKEKLYDVVEELTARGGEVTVYPIVPGRGLLTKDFLPYAMGEGYDVVACMGGDGTLNRVVNDLMALPCRPLVGYIPSGSTNDFANSLGLTDKTVAACQTIMEGNVFSIDVGAFNEKYFNYVAAFGAFTDVSYGTAQDIKNVMGRAAYLLQGIVSLPQAMQSRVHMKVAMDGAVKYEGEYLYGAVSNATSVGGFASMDAKRVKMDDGLFEVLLIRAPDDWAALNGIISSLLSGKPDKKYVDFFCADQLQFTSEGPVGWTLDGEFGGEQRQVDIRLCHRALDLLVPRNSEKELPAVEEPRPQRESL